MDGGLRARLSLILSISACTGAVGCSNSGGGSPGPSQPAAASSISAAQVTALQAIVQRGQVAPTVPTDAQTARLAAQIAELDHDRASELGAASMLQIAENDPSNKSKGAQLGIYRQKHIAQAAADVTKIAALIAGAKVSGKSVLGTDGGAAQVLESIVAQSFAAQAKAYLTAGSQAASNGNAGPKSDEISTFLQEEAIVTSDEGNGGHDVAGRVVGYALLADASLSSITTSVDGGAP